MAHHLVPHRWEREKWSFIMGSSRQVDNYDLYIQNFYRLISGVTKNVQGHKDMWQNMGALIGSTHWIRPINEPKVHMASI